MFEITSIQTDETAPNDRELVLRFALAQRTICLSPNSEILHGGYLCRALLCEQVRKSIEAHATGATVLGIKASSLKEILIPIPRLAEQLRIVAELNAETKQMETVRSLIPCFEAKIKHVFDLVWDNNESE
jgi:type I restriction enzyme S subunit